MSYNTPGFGFEEDDHPLASAFGFEGISDSFGAVDELAEIVWRKGPVAKHFVPPSSRMTETARSEDIRDSDTEAAARSGPGASRLFVEEGEMASWLYLTQDATDIGTAIPPTELGRQSTAAKMVSQVEAPRRESTEVGSSATPEVERALPAASRRVTVVDSNKSPGTCEVGSSATPEVERLPTAISRPTAAVDSSRFPWTCEERSAAAAAASSSGGSGGAGRTIHAAEDRKHKLHDSDDSDPEDAEYDSESKNHANLRSRKRTRSAEVHNLSERRRRDRINEKMKALQQLIPQCSKTDKASMLDDAVEYMKSLQLQIQMMRGRAPMTFPCFPQHTPPMGMAISGMGMDSNARNFIPNVWPYSPFMMGSAISIPTSVQSAGSIQMPAYFPAMLTVNGQLPYQPAIQQDPNSINFQALNPARRSAIPDPYHQFLGLHQMQIPQQNQTLAEHGGKNESNTIKTENPEHDL